MSENEKKSKHPKKAEQKRIGAPTKYNEKLVERLCEQIATRNVSLGKICREDNEFPDESTVRKWLLRHPSFRTRYFEAKRSQIDISIEELDRTMDEALCYYSDDKGNNRIDSPSASIAIAKAQNRKWYASKLAPKIYGDHRLVEELEGDNSRLREELRELRAKLDKDNIKEY